MIVYQTVSKQILLRAGQIGDAGTPAALAARYSGTLPNAVDGMELPLPALKQVILASEKRIAELIGFSTIQKFRLDLFGSSGQIESDAVIPQLSVSGARFVGNFSAVRDAATGRELTQTTFHAIERRLRNEGNFYKTPSFTYCFRGERILHTVETVIFDGCAYSESVASAAYDGGGNSVLPSSLETFLIADSLSNLSQEKWFVQESARWDAIAMRCEADLRGGREPNQNL